MVSGRTAEKDTPATARVWDDASSAGLCWLRACWYDLQPLRCRFEISRVLPHHPGIKRIYPDANLTESADWAGFPRPYSPTYLLSPLDPLFRNIGGMVIRQLVDEFGTDHIYNADTFNEMPPSSGDPKYLAAASRAVYEVPLLVPHARLILARLYIGAHIPIRERCPCTGHGGRGPKGSLGDAGLGIQLRFLLDEGENPGLSQVHRATRTTIVLLPAIPRLRYHALISNPPSQRRG